MKNNKYDVDLLLKKALGNSHNKISNAELKMLTRNTAEMIKSAEIMKKYSDKTNKTEKIELFKHRRNNMNAIKAAAVTILFVFGAIFATGYIRTLIKVDDTGTNIIDDIDDTTPIFDNTPVIQGPYYIASVDDFEIKVNANHKTAEINKYNGKGGNIIIPSEYENYPIVAINNGAFKDCKSITGIELPDSIIAIYDQAFKGCVNLAEITIDYWITSIGEEAFSGCTALTDLQITATSINQEAFSNCTNLTNVSISATKIEKQIFKGCTSLKTLTLSCTNLADEAFMNNTNLEIVVLYVTSIGDKAFFDCTNLVHVRITGTSIGNEVFGNCTNLQTAMLKNIMILGNNIFSNCSNFTDILVYLPPIEQNQDNWNWSNKAFEGCDKNKLNVKCPKDSKEYDYFVQNNIKVAELGN